MIRLENFSAGFALGFALKNINFVLKRGKKVYHVN